MATTTTGNATDYGEEILTDYLITQITELGLFSVAGGEDGDGTEFDAADYARVAVTMVKQASVDTSANSGGAINFGTPATDWGTCVEIVGFNGYGYAVAYWTVSPGVDCDAGAPVRIPVSGLTQRVE